MTQLDAALLSARLDELLAGQQRIERAVREIREQLMRTPLTDISALEPKDREVLGILLPAMKEAVGRALFTLADLREQASLHPGLAVALERIARMRVSQKSLGKLFARAADKDVGGAVIRRRRDAERDGVVWCVEWK